jgi:type I restriction enzyme M protein
MMLKQKRKNTDILFVDASKGFIKVGKNNKLRASDIKKIVDTVVNRDDVDKFSKKVSREEIRNNEYNLNIPRYVDSSDPAETWDIYASMFGGIPNIELNELKQYWTAFSKLKAELFSNDGTPYSKLITENIKQTINESVDIKKYLKKFDASFADFGGFLKKRLIENMKTVSLGNEETIISDDIFSRLSSVAIIDKYKAYQVLDDEWQKTAIDLEIIQSEGFEATRIVEPNLVIKKKDGKEEEVAEGLKGRVIPFELVQSTILKKEADQLKEKENRLAQINSEIEEILESFSEDEKEEKTNLFNDDNTAFAVSKLTAFCRTLSAETDNETDKKLLSTSKLFSEHKELKSKVNREKYDLENLTAKTIENLKDSEVLELLELKWVKTLVAAINDLPQTVIAELVTKTEAISKKYAVTYAEVATQTRETEKSLSGMISELTGSEFDLKGLAEFQALLKGGNK